MFTQALYAMSASGAGAQQQQQSPWGFFIMMAGFIAIFYFLMIRPQRKQQKEHQEMLKRLNKGDKVLTSGGVIGTIRGFKGNEVTLETGKNSSVTVLKNTISGLVKDEQTQEEK